MAPEDLKTPPVFSGKTQGHRRAMERSQQIISFQALNFTNVDAGPRVGSEGTWVPYLPWYHLQVAKMPVQWESHLGSFLTGQGKSWR